ncbi:hypothetical protein FIBSPDRAFT_157672 [Athelia psychrophila]|uniref:Uncharacterized protein n=1 Tax=Athelia psychrophila TaxID=1759441 RepID=A0A166BAF3_9AGAM|nr:hypothetical protein FIBSPDRAFT_157672 [Fibularhizoctonia sp. CBS 109695]
MFRLGSGRLASELRGPPSQRWLSTGKAHEPFKLHRYARRTAYFALGVGGIYVADRAFNASSVSRNFRTLWTCALISLDYKLNFTAEHPERIPEIHQRVADLMYKLFTDNGGLYIKCAHERCAAMHNTRARTTQCSAHDSALRPTSSPRDPERERQRYPDHATPTSSRPPLYKPCTAARARTVAATSPS